MKNKQHIIIGNGIGGLSAAEEIRKADPDVIIKIITQEEYLTYYRVKLSHFISKDSEEKGLLIHDENWYKERNIQVMLGRTVEKLNPSSKSILLDNGEKISYDKLLIACGSYAFIPPVDGKGKKGVFTLRNLEDLKNIQQYAKNCKEVAIIGGGLLGLEAAWALKERGLKVNVVEFSPYLLPRQLDEELGMYLKEKLEEMGLNIHLSAATKELTGEQKVEGVALTDGRSIPADMILFSTGIRSNIHIAEGTNLEVNRGIQVDQYMKTSVEDIYGAGDIAEFDGMVMGLWSVAMDQGKIAGKHMTGSKEQYVLPKAATLLSIGGMSLFSVGEIKEDQDTLSFRDKDVWHKLFIQDGKLKGGVLIGDMKKMVKLKRAVNHQVDLKEMIEKGMDPLEIMESL